MTYDEILAQMSQRYRELSGFDANDASDIGIRLKVLAAETAAVFEQIDELRAQVFPQTSSGKYLELHAQSRAITRKAAIPAEGTLTFSREIPASQDITIAAGVVCSTVGDPQIMFETTSDGVIQAGSYNTQIPAKAIDVGAIGNVATGVINIMISAAPGVTSVTNSAQFAGGVDEEDDASLKTRLLEAYQNISNGTNSAFYYDLAMGHEGVMSANVLPRKRGRGTVDVVVSSHLTDLEDDIVNEIQAELDVKKEINVDVLVRKASRTPVNLTLEIAVETSANFDVVKQLATAAIDGYIKALPVGAPLYISAISAKLLTLDGIYNCKILSPSADVIASSDHIIDTGTISVTRMAVG